jgi:UDP-3-O-[3-hydroxymyristoyl] glucosamine N-acyltransferase
VKVNLGELNHRFGGTVAGDPSVLITGAASLETAGDGDIAFAEKPRYYEQVVVSKAAAVVVGEQFPEVRGKNLWRVAEPRRTFIRIMRLFYAETCYAEGIHSSAAVAANARLGEAVTVCEHVVIRERVRIGCGSVIESGVHIGAGAVIGEGCWIGPNVALLRDVRLGDRVKVHAGSVIGGDGFGYLWIDNQHVKVPSFGSVQIDDDVEIGCNACIDRATFGTTRVRRGTKVDNLAQIAHNNDIGEDVIVVAQVGLSGTVKVGNRATLAGQVGVADHVEIGEGATVAAASGVSRDVKPGEVVWGFPARPMQKAWREVASLARLPRLLQRLRDLECRLEKLKRGPNTPDEKC